LVEKLSLATALACGSIKGHAVATAKAPRLRRDSKTPQHLPTPERETPTGRIGPESDTRRT
jgi:hypothetical protein